MRKNLTLALMATLALVFAAPAIADGPGDAGPNVAAPPVQEPIRARPQTPAEPSAAPVGRTGQISVMNNELALNVPTGYRFYSAEEAYAFMQRNGAAAPEGTVVGMIAAADTDIREPGAWATVLSYDGIGYVQPETASELDREGFETEVEQARSAQNRPFEGFIAEPAFANDNGLLQWAERAAAPGSAGADLRYEQKVLGRYGVACLTSIGSADQMTQITAAAEDLQAMLTFPAGRTLSDFDASADQVSDYTVPALVTGVPAGAEGANLVEREGDASQTAFGGLSGWFPWIALGVVVLAGVGYMAMRRRRDDEDEDDED